MHRLPLYLLVLILPLAVAGQNIGTGVVAAILFVQIWMRRSTLRARAQEIWTRQKPALLASAAFVAVLLAAGLANEANGRQGVSFLFGYLIWALLPPVAMLAQDDLDAREWRRLYGCLAVVVAIMGAVAAAQAVLGFKISGAKLVAGSTRAQGFYSHPLTFAYVTLMFFPLGCAAVARAPRDKFGWCVLAGSAVAVFASQSRTVQAVAALVALYNIVRFASGRLRLALLAGTVVVGAVVMATDNPVSHKFRLTMSPQGYDVRSDYPDDRVAFWRVATDMIRERPLIGHGENLDTAYRTPYYEAIGLGSFERKYEAHNMFLQAAVNGGVLGLAALIAWLAAQMRLGQALARLPRGKLGGSVAVQTLAALCLAAMTQNAIQDSEVRYAVTLVAVALALAGSVGGAAAVAAPVASRRSA